MGFYAPAQLVADARKHGVRVRGVDVNHSEWESTLESDANRPQPAIRLGLQTIRGLPSEAAMCLASERDAGGPYQSMNDLVKRAGLGKAVLAMLADADALGSLAGDRRAAVWNSLSQASSPGGQPLFESVEDDEEIPEALIPMTPIEEVYADYNTTGLSLKAHPISFLRDELSAKRCVSASDLPNLRDGRHVRVAGLVLLRQRPGTAKGITFVTLEDETGAINLVLFAAVWERFFRVARTSNAWLVDGKLENKKGVIHVIVGRITDLASELQAKETEEGNEAKNTPVAAGLIASLTRLSLRRIREPTLQRSVPDTTAQHQCATDRHRFYGLDGTQEKTEFSPEFHPLDLPKPLPHALVRKNSRLWSVGPKPIRHWAHGCGS